MSSINHLSIQNNLMALEMNPTHYIHLFKIYNTSLFVKLFPPLVFSEHFFWFLILSLRFFCWKSLCRRQENGFDTSILLTDRKFGSPLISNGRLCFGEKNLSECTERITYEIFTDLEVYILYTLSPQLLLINLTLTVFFLVLLKYRKSKDQNSERRE